ncbi:MAG: hypothetical protein E4G99_09210 [Anaerolineales bacterium]|jgi:hypothetical protein|nr:MAG: hypothetical protein E4G99_09210 [Anaerolineales bacterium]
MMKKYMILHVGYETPTPEIMGAWGKWFESIADKTVDPGSPLGPGKEISHSGTKEMPHDKAAITGYVVINADSMDDAVRIAKTCPIITSVRVYEAMSM